MEYLSQTIRVKKTLLYMDPHIEYIINKVWKILLIKDLKGDYAWIVIFFLVLIFSKSLVA